VKSSMCDGEYLSGTVRTFSKVAGLGLSSARRAGLMPMDSSMIVSLSVLVIVYFRLLSRPERGGVSIVVCLASSLRAQPQCEKTFR
jgi:hypothetical protein